MESTRTHEVSCTVTVMFVTCEFRSLCNCTTLASCHVLGPTWSHRRIYYVQSLGITRVVSCPQVQMAITGTQAGPLSGLTQPLGSQAVLLSRGTLSAHYASTGYIGYLQGCQDLQGCHTGLQGCQPWLAEVSGYDARFVDTLNFREGMLL